MSKLKPDISQIGLKNLTEKKFMVDDNYRIKINKNIYQIIKKHAAENTEIELCGVLIGDVFKDEDGPYLEITGSIRGENAVNLGAQVTFTHDTWEYINKIKDKDYSNKLMVGWYHTHPSFGIFLSSQDTFIQKNFFSEPWQVAYVIDPVSNDEGFFIWKEGEPKRVSEFWVNGEKNNYMINSKKMPEPNYENEIQTLRKRYKLFLYLFPAIIFGLILILMLVISSLSSIKSNFDKKINILSTRIETQSKFSLDIQEVKRFISDNKFLADIKINLFNKDENIWGVGEVYTQYHKEQIEKVFNNLGIEGAVDLRGVVVSNKYSTKPGDNLSIISDRVYGDQNKWIYIYNANKLSLSNPNKIQPFQELKLPEIKLIK